MMGLVGKVGSALFVVGLLLYFNFSVTSSSVPPTNVRGHHELGTHVRVVAEKLQSEISLSYAGFSLAPNGDIYLENVQIRPISGPDLITAERMVVRHADINYLRALWQELAMAPLSEGWPKRASIRLEGARIELSDQNVQKLDRLFLNSIVGVDKAVIAMFTCRDYDRFSFQILQSMGIKTLTGTFDLDYSLNTVDNELQAQVQLELDQLLTADAHISLATQPTQKPEDAIEPVVKDSGYIKTSAKRSVKRSLKYLNSEKLAKFPLELKVFRLNYVDQGGHAKRNKYCALTAQTQEDQYLAESAKQLAEHLNQRGWHLTPESINNFDAFLQPMSRFELDVTALKPYVVSGKTAQSLLPSAELLKNLDVQLVLNNKYENIREMWAGISLLNQGGSANIAEEEARKAAVRKALSEAVKGTPDQYKRAFKVISVEKAGAYTGKKVKLETFFGRKVEGRLQRVEGDLLYILQHVQQGNVVYPIASSKIDHIEVFY